MDANAWLSECSTRLKALYLASPRCCGEGDPLPVAELAAELIEDPNYRDLEPDVAGERFLQDAASPVTVARNAGLQDDL